MLVLASLVMTMFTIDTRTFTHVHRLPPAFVDVSYRITDFGKSGWLLLPLLALLTAGISACTYAKSRFVERVFAAVVVRTGFLFTAIGAPGLFTSIIKVITGRARPDIAAGRPFVFHPFIFRAQDMSFPSGHATTAFAAAMAITTLWPRIGIAAWIYALLIGASRVIVIAHFPSDVMASAVVGVGGALLCAIISLIADWCFPFERMERCNRYPDLRSGA